jgi:hypothetical protein
LTTLLLIVAVMVPLLAIGALVALARLLAATEVPEDTGSSRGGARPASLMGRLRAWLTSTPRKLAYRRDKIGRFRRVRRG